ncbi:hypothetical protein K474DRAFT_1701466 [Panus rudis PR-1116 ss-1]|nr:hypothetical protein K474DRAFT_1701466 [Panus rudis PR-1116 ss-1]
MSSLAFPILDSPSNFFRARNRCLAICTRDADGHFQVRPRNSPNSTGFIKFARSLSAGVIGKILCEEIHSILRYHERQATYIDLPQGDKLPVVSASGMAPCQSRVRGAAIMWEEEVLVAWAETVDQVVEQQAIVSKQLQHLAAALETDAFLRLSPSPPSPEMREELRTSSSPDLRSGCKSSLGGLDLDNLPTLDDAMPYADWSLTDYFNGVSQESDCFREDCLTLLTMDQKPLCPIYDAYPFDLSDPVSSFTPESSRTTISLSEISPPPPPPETILREDIMATSDSDTPYVFVQSCCGDAPASPTAVLSSDTPLIILDPEPAFETSPLGPYATVSSSPAMKTTHLLSAAPAARRKVVSLPRSRVCSPSISKLSRSSPRKNCSPGLSHSLSSLRLGDTPAQSPCSHSSTPLSSSDSMLICCSDEAASDSERVLEAAHSVDEYCSDGSVDEHQGSGVLSQTSPTSKKRKRARGSYNLTNKKKKKKDDRAQCQYCPEPRRWFTRSADRDRHTDWSCTYVPVHLQKRLKCPYCPPSAEPLVRKDGLYRHTDALHGKPTTEKLKDKIQNAKGYLESLIVIGSAPKLSDKRTKDS